jgi:CRP-like cAMP-binding protein
MMPKHVRHKCFHPGCNNGVVLGGVCVTHGALCKGCAHPGCNKRNASVSCVTPVHVISISKEYFNKYMNESGSEINMTLQELTRSRDQDQALQMIRHRKNLLERDFSAGDVLFSCGEDGK